MVETLDVCKAKLETEGAGKRSAGEVGTIFLEQGALSLVMWVDQMRLKSCRHAPMCIPLAVSSIVIILCSMIIDEFSGNTETSPLLACWLSLSLCMSASPFPLHSFSPLQLVGLYMKITKKGFSSAAEFEEN